MKTRLIAAMAFCCLTFLVPSSASAQYWLYVQFHLTATVQEPISETMPRTFRSKTVTINNAKLLALLSAATTNDFTGADLVVDHFGLGFSVIRGTNVIADISTLFNRSGDEVFVLRGQQSTDTNFNVYRRAVEAYQFMPNNAENNFTFRVDERDKIVWTSKGMNSTNSYFEKAHSYGFGSGYWNGHAAVFSGTVEISSLPPKPPISHR